MANNRKNNGKERARPKKPGGVTGRGFMPGKSGNPRGRPPGRGLLNCLKAAVAQRVEDGRSVEELLIQALVQEALRGRNRLAAIQAIFDRLEGKPKQQVDFNDITRALQGRSNEDLEHFAVHGCWPEDGAQEANHEGH